MRRVPTNLHIRELPWNLHGCGVEQGSTWLFTALRLIVLPGFKRSQTSDGVDKPPRAAAGGMRFEFET